MSCRKTASSVAPPGSSSEGQRPSLEEPGGATLEAVFLQLISANEGEW